MVGILGIILLQLATGGIGGFLVGYALRRILPSNANENRLKKDGRSGER